MKVHHVPEEKRFGLLDSTGTAWGELNYLVRATFFRSLIPESVMKKED